MYAIKATNLKKRYKDVTAVDGLNLQIASGKLFALLGVNGAGKTTLVRMLSTITKATDGDALVCGYSISREPMNVKRSIGVCPQETAVALNLSVRENLLLTCGIYGLKKEVGERRIAELSDILGLSSVLERRAGRLSGGWQRRLSIAMALVSEPSVLFLDEPTIGLDVIARSELWELIRALKGRMTIVLTTHYMEEAEALADEIGIMKDGRLLFTGTLEDIKNRTGEKRLDSAFVKIIKEERV